MSGFQTLCSGDWHAVMRTLQSPQPHQRAFLGFDGYVDALYRVVKQRTVDGGRVYYAAIEDYARRLLQASGKSADIELSCISRQQGGNAPLLAEALTQLGVKAALCGTVGSDQVNACFASLQEKMKLYPIGEPFETIALEFNDGKIMMGNLSGQQAVCRDTLLKKVGLAALRQEIEASILLGMVNWSALDGLCGIAQEIEELLHDLPDSGRKLCFFDLSDPTALPEAVLRRCLSQMCSMGHAARTVLSMNDNEAGVVFRCLMGVELTTAPSSDEWLMQQGMALAQVLGMELVCMHTLTHAYGFTAKDAWKVRGFHVAQPTTSTGGGDHFNAGMCMALMNGLSVPQALLLGSAAASCFVQSGKSADNTILLDFLKNC